MKNNIYTIILGNNQNLLFGSSNDSILIYNIFYRFYLNTNYWKKPLLFINKDVTILNILNKIKTINTFSTIIIYFSGHSSKIGKLNFFNKLYSSSEILKKIDSLNNIKKHIFFIIDSCYSELNINTFKYKNIILTTYIVSSKKNQTSKEILIKYDFNMFKYKNLALSNITNNKIVISIFTYYFYKILNGKNLNNLNDWKINLVNNILWNIIEKKYNQKIYYVQN